VKTKEELNMKGLKRFIAIILVGLISFSISACNNKANEVPTGENVGSFASYDELKDYLLTFYEKSGSVYYLGGNLWMEEADVALDGAAPTQEASTRDYSKTNNQVEGVEEADRILTDGYKIYIASGSTFFIVDADTLDVDFSYSIDNGTFNGLYLYQNRVVLISYEYEYIESEDCIYYYYDEVAPADDATESQDETLTSDSSEGGDISTDYVGETTNDTTEYCWRWTYTYGTHIRVFDISDTTDPTLEREVYFDSSYLIDSRMIDEQLYLVLDNYMISYYFNDEIFVPRYMDSAVSDQLVSLPANQIYFMPNDGESFGYLVLASFDVTNDTKEASIKSYLGSTYQIYMSADNLYTTVYRWNYLEDEGRYEYNTFILRFEIVDDELEYKAMAKVAGSPLNQFSMDEYDGVFRIATTGYTYDQDTWTSEINNYLYLLDATTEGEMDQISVLPDLGEPGERIYAVRFYGDIAYVVTFVQTDPLYKLDLSDPQNPAVVDELHEEGVNDYLHQITDNLLLGVGRLVNNDSGWTRFTGVKVSLYDTSEDITVNLETYQTDAEYSYTNVMYDHKAFLSFTPTNADFTYVAIPIYNYYDDYSTCSQNEYLFKVYHSGDLEFVTELSHMTADSDGYYRYFDSIERAVIIDNHIYTMSYSSIHMFDMSDNFSEIAVQELNPSYYEYYGYPVAVDTVND